MPEPYKRQSYRYYDKEKYLDFQDKLRRNELSFQGFVSWCIDEFLKENINPKGGVEMTTIFLDVVNVEPGYYFDPETDEVAHAEDDQKWRIVDQDRAILCKWGVRTMDASGATMIDPFENEEECFDWIRENINKDHVYIDGPMAENKKVVEEKLGIEISEENIYNFEKTKKAESVLETS